VGFSTKNSKTFGKAIRRKRINQTAATKKKKTKDLSDITWRIQVLEKAQANRQINNDRKPQQASF